MKTKAKSRLLALVMAFAMVVGPFMSVANAMENEQARPLLLEDQVEVKIEKAENGSVKFCKDGKTIEDTSLMVDKGEKVVLEVKANEDYELEKLESKTADETEKLEVKDDKIELTVLEDIVISSKFKAVKVEEEQKTEQRKTTDNKQETQPVKEEKKLKKTRAKQKKMLKQQLI